MNLVFIQKEIKPIHLWKKDGTNVLYQVEKRETGMWEITDITRVDFTFLLYE